MTLLIIIVLLYFNEVLLKHSWYNWSNKTQLIIVQQLLTGIILNRRRYRIYTLFAINTAEVNACWTNFGARPCKFIKKRYESIRQKATEKTFFSPNEYFVEFHIFFFCSKIAFKLSFANWYVRVINVYRRDVIFCLHI